MKQCKMFPILRSVINTFYIKIPGAVFLVLCDPSMNEL